VASIRRTGAPARPCAERGERGIRRKTRAFGEFGFDFALRDSQPRERVTDFLPLEIHPPGAPHAVRDETQMAKKKATRKPAGKAAGKKAGKKAAATASGDYIISKSRTKGSVNCNVSGEFYGAFDAAARAMLKQAEARAEANGRRTLRPQDL